MPQQEVAEKRILKQRGREDLKEGIRFLTELLGAIGPLSGSSAAFLWDLRELLFKILSS